MAMRGFFLTTCLAVFSSVNGCGQLPQRQVLHPHEIEGHKLVMLVQLNSLGLAVLITSFLQARTLNYEITGFELPPPMVYIETPSARSQVPNISSSEQEVVTFVKNIVMSSVEDVLHQQGRGAGLSDDLITLILNQLDITVSYKPLKCDIIFLTANGVNVVMNAMTNCQILSGTVTKTCTMTMPVANNNPMLMCAADKLMNIDPMHLIISGSITTTNIIMANWSTQMWQIVLNRALRSLTSGPLRSQFVAASVTLK